MGFRFVVVDERFDATSRVVQLAPKRRGGPCVTMLFGSRGDNDDAVVIEDIRRKGATCATAEEPPLPRKYGTRLMLLAMLNAFVVRARKMYPHLRRFELADEATYDCPGPLQDIAEIKTFATDLLLQDRTYYERHLNMAMQHPASIETRAALLDRVRREPKGVSFGTFFAFLTTTDGPSRTVHRPGDVRFLLEHEPLLRAAFRRSRSFRAFFADVHAQMGCTFFAACWRRLLHFFGAARLQGAVYAVAFDDLPPCPEPLVVKRLQRGGGSGAREHVHGMLIDRRRVWARR